MRKLIEKIDTWILRRRLKGIMRDNKIPLSNEEKEILRKRKETRGGGLLLKIDPTIKPRSSDPGPGSSAQARR